MVEETTQIFADTVQVMLRKPHLVIEVKNLTINTECIRLLKVTPDSFRFLQFIISSTFNKHFAVFFCQEQMDYSLNIS